MTLMYYFILAFGAILFLYTAQGWRKTRRKIHPHDVSLDKTKNRIAEIKKKIQLWQYYFIGGDRKKLARNIFISGAIFLILFFINVAYVRLERWLFVLIFVCLFIILVWKLGQYRNQKMFNAMFPEVIQIMNAAATGGAGLLQSLERCGKDLTGQLGEEFKAIHKRLALGEDPMSVFEDSYSRYPYKEFYFFITIIRTNLSKGGQIREVITRLGRVIADSKKMEQKKKAMTSEARMSAFIVASFPIAFFLFMQFAMPENFDFLLNDPSGRYVLYYVFGSEAFGMLIIWWLMRKST
ncbi:type II secretion system F family protein [Pasteurella multocida]|uniref:type II secretion system F family protein n=1 Tax=Pasteurella multocida TaxID=747 RepID=UPI0002827D2E|nr:type II secretion system F family protein [Pasteurella multocida]ARB73088.1 protein dehydratase [Pasteurella multocida]EJZ79110.1 Flp pilus assembly protein TadB [Pasteurella multocida subsp. gallicida X73]MCL7791566.1 type II secretion system F family protein [Pasteurella multocida]OBP28256.1 protein dehydratase [Pasteurella multocida subsp. multocida]URH94476.1 type II secretion system F family protein [Pasteurella multocida]